MAETDAQMGLRANSVDNLGARVERFHQADDSLNLGVVGVEVVVIDVQLVMERPVDRYGYQ